MFGKVLNLVIDKDYMIPKLLLFNYKDLGISNEEFIILIYLINQKNNIYNPKEISENLKMDLSNVLTSVSDMNEKGIIKVYIENNNGRQAEFIDLNNLYEKLTFTVVNSNDNDDTSIHSLIEKEFARPLSSLECELINTWIDNGFSNELIEEALKEAVYNNAKNLKYIDKILDNWKKLGIKTKEDVFANKKKFKERKKVKEAFDYDWLNEE